PTESTRTRRRSWPPRLTLRRNVQSSGVTSLQMHIPGPLGTSWASRSRITPWDASVSVSESCRYLLSCAKECIQHLMFTCSPSVSHKSSRDRRCWLMLCMPEPAFLLWLVSAWLLSFGTADEHKPPCLWPISRNHATYCRLASNERGGHQRDRENHFS